MRLRHLAIIAALLPCVAIYGSYGANAWLGHAPWCVPNIGGCVSVSRGARAGEGLFLFRAIMMPYALLLIVYWLVCYRWLLALGDTSSRQPFLMFVVGSLGALALLAYTNVLGTDGTAYRVMRSGVVFFFAFTALSQALLVSRLYHVESLSHGSRGTVLRFMRSVCVIEAALGCGYAFVSVFVDEGTTLERIIEWNVGVLLFLFSFGVYALWKKTDVRWRVHVRA